MTTGLSNLKLWHVQRASALLRLAEAPMKHFDLRAPHGSHAVDTTTSQLGKAAHAPHI